VDDKSLYAAILGLKDPWGVEKVDLRLADGAVHIWVALPDDTLWVCPDCLAAAPIHDHRDRVWRHLDTCQYRTLVHARIPRLNCPTHGIRQVRVPWAEEKARFTALFEALAIDWLKHAAIATVAARLRLSWDEAAGIQAPGGHARPGAATGDAGPPSGHRRDRVRPAPPVRHGGDGPGPLAGALCGPMIESGRASTRFGRTWPPPNWRPSRPWRWTCGSRTSARLELICRRPTPRSCSTSFTSPSTRTRRLTPCAARRTGPCTPRATTGWSAPNSTGSGIRRGSPWPPGREFVGFVRRTKLKTGRAWALKEMLMTLWDYVYPGAAERHFAAWYAWAIRSRLEPMKHVARMLRRHWPNIQTFFTQRITNAGAESMNSKIQKIKVLARGFRNRARFRMAIYFHLGGLDLYPAPLTPSS
jgi:transposase